MLGAILGATPGIGGKPKSQPEFSERFFSRFCVSRAPELFFSWLSLCCGCFHGLCFGFGGSCHHEFGLCSCFRISINLHLLVICVPFVLSYGDTAVLIFAVWGGVKSMATKCTKIVVRKRGARKHCEWGFVPFIMHQFHWKKEYFLC